MNSWIGLEAAQTAIDGASTGYVTPSCGQRMKLRAVVKGPPASERILRGLAVACRGPPELATN